MERYWLFLEIQTFTTIIFLINKKYLKKKKAKKFKLKNLVEKQSLV